MVEQERAFKGEDVVRFLKTCDAPDYTGKLLIIWDGSPIHRRGQAQSKIFSRAGQPRGYNLSSYLAIRCSRAQPSDEGIWKHLKYYVELKKNVCCRSLSEF
jgi:hypothetical protein